MSEQLETARARRDRIAAWREMLAAGRVAALLSELDTKVGATDTVSILPAVAGGAG